MNALIPTNPEIRIAVEHGWFVHIGDVSTYVAKNKAFPHIGGIELTDNHTWIANDSEYSDLLDAIAGAAQ